MSAIASRRWPPVVGICGDSGSGKTTLIEHLVPRLAQRGLRVAVVKHCTHAIDADHPGKDSDRIFQAGADILASGPREAFARYHEEQMSLEHCLERIGVGCDVVLVEGYRGVAIPKIRLGDSAPDDGEVLLALPDGMGGHDEAELAVWQLVECAHASLPVTAAVLVGGHSARMGTSKAMLKLGDMTLLERVVAAAAPHAEEVVLAGEAETPASLARMKQLPDAPGVQGPLAGLLCALRWRPGARWIALACDLGRITPQAVGWLREQAAIGADAVVPTAGDDGCWEPLFALYEPSARPFLERAASGGEWGLRRALHGARVLNPRPPTGLHEAWTNVNTPQDLETLRQLSDQEHR